MKHIKLTPLDTLFFRDGSPFNAGETGQMEVTSVFPPSASTVVGCLRAAFAREMGWSGKREERWNKNIIEHLGDGADLRQLEFTGPYLLHNNQLLFPVPSHLLAKGKDKAQGNQQATDAEDDSEDTIDQLTFLRPSDEILHTDIGEVRLPSTKPDKQGFKNLGQAYVTSAGMSCILRGHRPDKTTIITAKNLWQSETRIGIHRDDKSRTTKEDALYQAVHTRLARGVSLGMGVTGYAGNIPKLATLGGESRMVWLEEDTPWGLPESHLEPKKDTLHYTVIFITPAQLSGDGWQKPKGTLPGLPGHIVSACVGKPVLIGGWFSGDKEDNTENNSENNTETKRYQRGSRPLEPFLPAGSIFFMAASASDLDNIKSEHNSKIGQKTAWGYGHILIGAWA